MFVDNWNGYDIRFVEINNEWYAVLKDICDALGIASQWHVRDRIPVRFLEKARIIDPRTTETNSVGAHSQLMIVVSSRGIYHAFFKSRKLEAQKFVDWILDTVDSIRAECGYSEYETMSFADSRAKLMVQKSNEDYVREYADAAYRMRFWDGEKWVIETGFDYMTLEEYISDTVPEEIADEVYDLCYSMLGGQC